MSPYRLNLVTRARLDTPRCRLEIDLLDGVLDADGRSHLLALLCLEATAKGAPASDVDAAGGASWLPRAA